MPNTENYEVLIIGSGEAGKNLAWTMGKAGHRTAVIERKLIGGSCPNIACLPSKNVIHSAKVASFAHRGKEFGLQFDSLRIDMAGVQNESEANAKGIDYRIVKIPMSSVLRMQTLSELRGFIKMLIAVETDHILGLTVFGFDASEILAVVQTAMLAGLPYTTLRDTMFTHPTPAEGLTVLLANVPVKQAQKAA